MPSFPDSKHFYTVAEFAELTGDSESTIRREIRAGNLPYQQSGPRKKIKIPLEALELRSVSEPYCNQTLGQQPEQAAKKTETFSGPKPDWMD